MCKVSLLEANSCFFFCDNILCDNIFVPLFSCLESKMYLFCAVNNLCDDLLLKFFFLSLIFWTLSYILFNVFFFFIYMFTKILIVKS